MPLAVRYLDAALETGRGAASAGSGAPDSRLALAMPAAFSERRLGSIVRQDT